MTRTPTWTALLLLGLAAPVLAEGGRLNLLGSELQRGVTLRSITADAITFLDREGKERKADVEDLVDLSFERSAESVRDPGPADVAVLLRGGDVIHGRLVPGKEEYLSLSSPLLGRLLFSVDYIAEVRFSKAWESVPERPGPQRDALDRDVFTYRHLDRVEGSFVKVTPRAVVAYTRISPTYAIDFEKLLMIRFADAPDPEPPQGRVAVLLLTDGSRLTTRELTSDGKVVRAKTVRNEVLEVELSSLLAVYQTGGRFVYLSDLPPEREKIVPWMGEVYAWDRPRYDRSFLDKPLRVGGESFRKGVGVISGTSITWKVEGAGFTKFTSRIALDDVAGEEGDAIFEVLVDGESRFRSETLRALPPGASAFRIPVIDIDGAHEITLRVTYVDDFVMDFADWIEPVLIR